jgi:hypothetical protein
VSCVDRYGLPITAASAAACDAYVDAVDRFLAARTGIDTAIERALGHDPDFALAHALLARLHQVHGRGTEARAAMQRAVALAAPLTPRERGHLNALAKVVAGDAPGALTAIREHLAGFPRDALVLLPCVGVFGLFGFSGQPGREAALAEFLAPFARHYGDDWWFRAVLAFAQAEVGDLGAARAHIDHAMTANPLNANGAHVRAHVDYESACDADGLEWLSAWLAGYDRAGLMHCHLAWHVALWNLDLGRRDAAWAAYEANVQPGGAWGPPLNVLTDAGSFLFRAELAGEPRPVKRWREIADYARSTFPQPGLCFADAHAALAYAMADDAAALDALIAQARGPAADMVVALAHAFGAFARGEWTEAATRLETIANAHERLGGSRAQRDLIDYALLVSERRAGRRASRRRTRPLPATLAGRAA